MKKLLLFLLISFGLNAQFNYQAIVKDSDGNPVTNNQVKFKFSLMYQSSTATPVFIEEHEVITPPDGVVNLSVGGGTVVNGTFFDIDWSQSVFMKEELDTGSGYQDMGTRKVASVPVAEFAKSLSGFESDDYFNIKIGDGALSSHTIGTDNIAIGQSALSSNTTGIANVAIGMSSLSNDSSGNENIGIGLSSLFSNNGGYHNIGIGSLSLSSNVSGTENIAIGNYSLKDNEASNNIGIGFNTLSHNVSGTQNVAIGRMSLYLNNSDGNTAVGFQSMMDNQSGIQNTALGWKTLTSNVSGRENTAIGTYSLGANISGYQNTAVGASALHFNLGSGNIAVGKAAMYLNSTGGENTAVGHGALYSNTSGNNNTAVGSSALPFSVEGNNVGVGYLSGTSLVSGTLNTAIGYSSDISNNLTNATAIGANASVTSSNTIQLGNTDVTLVNTSGIVSATGFKGSGDEITLTDNGTTNELIKIIDDLRNEIKNLKKEITECPIILSAGYIGSDEPFDNNGEYVICNNTIPNIITPLSNSSPLTNGDATLSYYWQLSTDGFKTFTNIFEDSLEYQLPALNVTTQVRRVVEAFINDVGATSVCTKTSNILTFKIPDPLRITHDANNGIFTAQVEGGTTPYTLTLFNNNNQIIDQVVTNNNGKSYVGLTPGENYRLEVWGAYCLTTEMTFTYSY